VHAPNRLDGTAQTTALVAPSRPGTRDAYRRVYRRIAVTDAFAVILALALSSWIMRGEIQTSGDFALRLVGTAAAIVVVFASFHLYEAFRYTPAEEFRRIILAVTLGVAGLMIVSFWSRADYSRGWVALSLAFAVVFTLITRRIWHAWIARRRTSGELAFRTLIVGTNEEATWRSGWRAAPSGSSPSGWWRPGRGPPTPTCRSWAWSATSAS
jgi:hypothetical protein